MFDFIQITEMTFELSAVSQIILPIFFIFFSYISNVAEIVHNILPNIGGQNCANSKSSMTSILSWKYFTQYINESMSSCPQNLCSLRAFSMTRCTTVRIVETSDRISVEVVVTWQSIYLMVPSQSLWKRTLSHGRFSLKSNLREIQKFYTLEVTRSWKKLDSRAP